MSYFRGEYYIFYAGPHDDKDTDHIQFWCPELDGKLPINIFDELVVMRYSELVEEGLIHDVEERVVTTYADVVRYSPPAEKERKSNG